MNVGQLFQRILDAFNAFRAGNKLAAFLIVWEIVQVLLNSIPPQSFGMPAPVMAGVGAIDIEAATTDELMQHVEALKTAAPAGDPVSGTWVAILLPLLIELAKRWWLNK